MGSAYCVSTGVVYKETGLEASTGRITSTSVVYIHLFSYP